MLHIYRKNKKPQTVNGNVENGFFFSFSNSKVKPFFDEFRTQKMATLRILEDMNWLNLLQFFGAKNDQNKIQSLKILKIDSFCANNLTK